MPPCAVLVAIETERASSGTWPLVSMPEPQSIPGWPMWRHRAVQPSPAVHVQRGAALADTFASFVRVHLACVRLCDMKLPLTYARQLSRLMYDELKDATAFKRAATLLHANDTSEEVWRARSLLQLITDVFAASAPFKGVYRRAEQCRWRFQALTQSAEGEGDPNAMAALNLNKGSARQTMSRALPVEDNTARLHFDRAAQAQAALAHEVQLLHVKHAILGGMPAAACIR